MFLAKNCRCKYLVKIFAMTEILKYIQNLNNEKFMINSSHSKHWLQNY